MSAVSCSVQRRRTGENDAGREGGWGELRSRTLVIAHDFVIGLVTKKTFMV